MNGSQASGDAGDAHDDSGVGEHGSTAPGTSAAPGDPSADSARLPVGVAQIHPDAPAAVLMVDLPSRTVLYANDVATQMAPDLPLPVTVDAWADAADLRDLDGEPLDETAHPLSRIARFEPVAGQGVSAARSSDLGQRREPLWVVALPLDDAPNLAGHALVVFLPVRDREALQQRASVAHAGDAGAAGGSALTVSVAAPGEGVAVREAAVLATGLSFTVADARSPDMPLVWVNPAFTAVTGYTFEKTVGTNCRFLQGPGTDPAGPARIRAALDAGEAITETLLNFRADGTAFWNQVALSPIHDADGVLTHYVGIQTDVSGRVAADAERDRALAAATTARTEAEVARGEAESARAEAESARAETEKAHERLQLLAEVTRQLSEVIDPEQALDRLAHLLVPRLADFAILAMVTDATHLPAATAAREAAVAADARGGRLGMRDIAWWHRDPDLGEALGDHARTRLQSMTSEGRLALASLVGPDAGGVLALPDVDGTDLVAEGGVVARVNELLVPGPAQTSLAQLAPTSMATLPLRSRGRTLGLMTLATDASRPSLSAGDLALAADIATRAGLALDRSRLFRQQKDLAEGLQRTLLDLSPKAAPAHVQVAVRYVAAAEAAAVGGDFYDVFAQSDGAAVMVIGDVMGHDTQAAAAMSQLRSIVRTLGMVGTADPRQVLTRTDEVMRASGVETTATAAIVRLDAPSGSEKAPDPGNPSDARSDSAEPDSGPEQVAGSVGVAWSNAGHPPPVVVDASGKASLLEAESTDLLLGVEPVAVRGLHRTRLAPGDLLLLYTDGLVERRDQGLSQGLARLQVVVEEAARSCGDLEELVDAVLVSMLPAASSDDVAVLAVCVR